MAQAEDTVTTLYINKYYEKNLSSSEVTTSYYLSNKQIAQRKGTTLSYIHQDSLSSTSVTTDSTGTLTSSVKYFPFGSQRSSTGIVPTDKQFTGQRLDGTGLYYYGARYYDAGIGRFISPDIYIQDSANPQCLNRYSYCINNPLKYIDPSGNMPVAWLNGLSTAYNSGALTPGLTSTAILLCNIGNIYNGFHEIAQINIAKRLSEMGYVTQLEYGIGSGFEVDIVANGKFAWEVKQTGVDPSSQLNKYIQLSNGFLQNGFRLNPIDNIPIFNNIKMQIVFDDYGGANYSFYKIGGGGQKVTVTSNEVIKELRYTLILAAIVAGGIVVGTLAEDVVTGGAGIADDVPSVIGALGTAAAILGVA